MSPSGMTIVTLTKLAMLDVGKPLEHQSQTMRRADDAAGVKAIPRVNHVGPTMGVKGSALPEVKGTLPCACDTCFFLPLFAMSKQPHDR